ncbi:MAG: hypothetical protein RLZZ450_301 [Pseudomonadota bacterium]|jgi:hypothetical protein
MTRGADATMVRYRARVIGYLQSPLGVSTPDSVAAKLLALDPCSIGLPVEPSAARLHATRAYLEAWEIEDKGEARHAS